MTDNNTPIIDPSRRKLITAPTVGHEGVSLSAFLVVWVISTLINLVLLGALGGTFFFLGQLTRADAPPPLPEIKQTAEIDAAKNDLDLTNVDVGDDTNTELAYPNDRIDEISTPGKVDPGEQVGVPDAPSTAPLSTPPPPGGGSLGTGAAAFDPTKSGLGSDFGLDGGFAGAYTPGGFGGRSSSTKRKELLAYGGGNKESEAAVALGLEWLALHQCANGRWSLHQFNRHARTAPLPGGKVVPDNSEPGVARSDDTGGTALGLLPFLAAGITPKSKLEQNMKDYRKGVERGLAWLLETQVKSGATRGSFGGPDLYSHGLATIAMCEAYALTGDLRYKTSAQLALDYIVAAQHSAGGWRYRVNEAGDTSVTGWQVMALRSGQMAGLRVDKKVFKGVESFLKSVAGNEKGTFRYTADNEPGAAMTAVGALCLQYMNVPRRNDVLQGAVAKIKQVPPAMSDDTYYLYYATQVMHHMGDKDWDFWNLGPKGDGKGGIRDTLLARQNKGAAKKADKGSFDPKSFHDGGRLGATAMNLLSLEVYYRHLPLYKDMTGK